MLRALADEHVTFALVNGLRTRGIDVVTVQDLGRRSDDDPLLLDWAIENERSRFFGNRRRARRSARNICTDFLLAATTKNGSRSPTKNLESGDDAKLRRGKFTGLFLVTFRWPRWVSAER